MNDGRQTGMNFNQTMYDVNTLNKNLEPNTKSKEFANTANEKQSNNLMNSGDKTIEIKTNNVNKSVKEIANSQEKNIYEKNVEQPIIQPNEIANRTSLFFRLHVAGIIESASFYEGDAIYCKYDIVHGVDWEKEDGQLNGQSQYACRGEGNFDYFVWNMPFEFGFRSLNPSGWPQIVITCVYPDFLGREVIKGYGVVHIPTQPGRHERILQIFSPITSSVILKLIGIIAGQRAEIINAPKVISTGEGREITRAKSEGTIKVIFQVTLRDMDKFGYTI